jgi:hypothetical protein
MEGKLIEELELCLRLWDEEGCCEFGGHTKCEYCAAPYLLYKLITGKALHGKMSRLNLKDWKKKLVEIKYSTMKGEALKWV